MVNYNRRMGNGVPTIMDYASPYINLAFTLKDREKEEENRELNKEQLKLENEWKNKQMGFQENANRIASETFDLNKQQQEIENATRPASQRPLSKELVVSLKDEMAKKDAETGVNLYGAYAEPMKVLSESAGKKPALESYYDFTSSLATNKDAIISSLQAEIPKAKGDPQKISALNKAIADVRNGGEMMVSKFFPGIHAMVKAEQTKANQARLDKMAEKDVEGNKVRMNTLLNSLKSEYDELSKTLVKYRSGEKDLDGKPLISPESASRMVKRQKAIKNEINNMGRQSAIGGNPQINASPQPTPRPSISGGVNQDVLLPENGAAISSTKESEPTTVRTQPPPIEEDIMVINRFASIAAEKGADLKNLDAFDKIVKDAKKRHKDNPEAVKSIDQTIELAKVGISETDVSSIMRMYGVDRPTAIAILKNQKEIKSAVGKVIKSGIDKGVSAISKGAEKGIDFLSKSNSYNAF